MKEYTPLISLWAQTIILLVYLIQRYRRPKFIRDLPGPRGYPLIGNYIDFPKSHPWLKFKEWGDTYGPIYQLKVFGVTYVIINDAETAEELLSERGFRYSGRSNFEMITMMTGGMDLAITAIKAKPCNGICHQTDRRPSNDYWRRGRKFAASVLGSNMVPKWDPVQAREATRMVVDMVCDPTRYQFWLERASTCASVRLTFGKNLPGAEEAEYHTQRITERMHEIERIAENPPSFARFWSEKDDHYNLEWREAAYVIATLHGGGSGTTLSTMQSYCLAMCHFPEWQKRLHDEIEQVVGSERAPNLDDIGNLPIVRAVSKELLRWRPVVPIGIPHRVAFDDEYEGYRIPAGALVVANQWGIHREKQLYPDGDEFDPERWLDMWYSSTYEHPTAKYPTIRRFSAFGIGRRICPGYDVAERALFIQIASLEWACRIKKKKTVNGEEIALPLYEYSSGVTSQPLNFQFDVEPYEARRVEVLKNAWEEAIDL
ncbi:uncharacterized protein TRUGW13939_05335 [Talaromyces rugulosus]|uniref:Cytochrome P450 n=1 Tax=Talaromyces rugulosus TaxID=121627 RepID=A0A7H8QVY5_TALRU|nr:uncharacterized protein TRUGW13939_05335 [Talaromyces rugulosus]QKX58214.1 hypothetical protein TRUGW13939_05335 [Talaromyces rugulosus]